MAPLAPTQLAQLSQRFDVSLLLRSWMRQPKKPPRPTRRDRSTWFAWSSQAETPPLVQHAEHGGVGGRFQCWNVSTLQATLEDVDGRHIVEHNAVSASNVFEVIGPPRCGIQSMIST